MRPPPPPRPAPHRGVPPPGGGLVGLVAVVQHVPDWLKRRYPWYIQLFNVSNYTVDALAAWAVAHVVLTTSLGDPSLRLALAGLGASLTFVLVNHVLLAGVLLL